MKALVTGGTGFLGTYVVEELERRGWEVDAPSHLAIDLKHSKEVSGMFRRLGVPDVVVHCAAAVGGIGANERFPGKFFYENAVMGIHLMEVARNWRVPKMVTIGTACMYPEALPSPQSEDDLWNGYPAPATAPYAFAKRAILEMGMAYRQQYDFNAVMVIPTNLYGPRDNFNTETGHVIPAMIRRFAESGDGPVTLWGSGSPTRDFLYAEDAARGIVDAVERYDRPEPVNLGSGVETSIKDLAETIAILTGYTGEILWDETRPAGTPHRCLSTDRALGSLGWSAQTSLDVGLAQTIEWWRAIQ